MQTEPIPLQVGPAGCMIPPIFGGCMARAILDLSGQRFGRLTAVSISHRDDRNRLIWRFKCDCGGEAFSTAGAIRGGGRTSCGCKGFGHPTHNESKTRLYRIWLAMRARCQSQKHVRFARYGGRGIRVCAEWDRSYEAFAAWAKANHYTENLQIDRIDNDGDYTPGNCRWVTAAVNMANRSCSK